MQMRHFNFLVRIDRELWEQRALPRWVLFAQVLDLAQGPHGSGNARATELTLNRWRGTVPRRGVCGSHSGRWQICLHVDPTGSGWTPLCHPVPCSQCCWSTLAYNGGGGVCVTALTRSWNPALSSEARWTHRPGGRPYRHLQGQVSLQQLLHVDWAGWGGGGSPPAWLTSRAPGRRGGGT